MNKKILIVTGSDYTPQVYQAFYDVKALGHTLYLLSDGSFEPKKGVFEKHFTHDLRKTKEALEYMKKQPVYFDAVAIKTSEWLTPLTAFLAKEYDCIGNDPIVAFNCRSKYHMRQQLQQNGIPIPQFTLARDEKEIIQAVGRIGLPCILKPVGGNASYGTFILRDETDLKNLREKYSFAIDFLKKKAVSEDVFTFTNEEMNLMGVEEPVNMVTDYLVEELMTGNEISVDALVQNDCVTLMGIEDQIRMAPPYVLETAARLPYVCSEKEMAEIQNLIERTVRAMGIHNSATHTEIMFTPEGAKIVEIGCRIGGDDLHDTIFEVTGYNLMYESIMIALGMERKYNVPIQCHTFMEFIFPKKEGKINKITVPENLKKDFDLFEITLMAKEGDEVALPPKSFDYIGYVAAKGKTPEEAENKAKQALKKIIVNIQ